MNINYIDVEKTFGGLNPLTARNTTRITDDRGITYIEFTPFDKFDWVKLHFSTRIGGVSSGIFSSMNFAFDRGEDIENVYKNYDLFLETMGLSRNDCVCSRQTHTTNVLAVDRRHAGMGLTKDRDFDNIDGLITNEKNLCLVHILIFR